MTSDSPLGPVYIYRAEAKRIIDGDTFVAMIDLGFEAYVAVKIRVRDVNAAEMSEIPKGPAAKSYLGHLLQPSGGPPAQLLIRSFGRSFERWIADVFVRQPDGWVGVAGLIVAAGFGSWV